MVLVQNYFMAFFAVLALIMSISFYKNETETGNIRIYVLALGLSAFAANAGYMMMSIRPINGQTLTYRNVGIIGINLFTYIGIKMVLSNVDIDEKIRKAIGFGLLVLTVVTLIFHCLPNDLSFALDHEGYTTFSSNHTIGYYLQIVFTFVTSLTYIVLFVIWFKAEKHKRSKRFVALMISAIALYTFSSTPYFMGVKTSHPAFLYCMGAMLAFAVVCVAGRKMSAFAITAQSLGTDVFGAVNIGLVVYDLQGELIIRNDYAKNKLKIFDHLGLKSYEVFDISEEKFQEVKDILHTSGRCENRVRAREDGRIYSVNSVVKYDKYNEPLCVICSVIDVTKEEEMIEQIIHANNAKSDFLASMSHEIRTPINAVLGMNELIIRESSEKAIVDYAVNIESSGKMLLAIINDILDFSKIESGKMDLIPVEYDLSSVINDEITMISTRMEEKNLKLDVDVDPTLPSRIKGDEVRVRQIMTNLLTNAAKYTEAGTVSLCVSGEVIDDNVKMSIAVKDTGKGIKEEDLPNLFSSFTRLDQVKNRTIEGTGLGLALTKSFAEMMGGEIKVESVYGQGSTFTVTIIQQVISSAPIGNFNERIASKKEKRKTKGMKIDATGVRMLVVDDVEINCLVLEGLLKMSGAEIDSAFSGRQAIDICEQNKYDLIFMDHMMPEIDGIEALKQIRTGEINKDTPVVVLTANAVVGAKENYLAEGFNDFLAKPIAPDLLEETIHRIIPDKVKMKE